MNCITYDSTQTWCRAPIVDGFYFKNVDHAITNNFFGERHICPCCLRKVIIALLEYAPHAPPLTHNAQNGTVEG
jgi:hypothetical protein